MIIGFTGSRHGMTGEQRYVVRGVLAGIVSKSPIVHEFHHGNCLGADVEAAKLAREWDMFLIAHPTNMSSWQADIRSHRTLPPLLPLIRNREIVKVSHMMIAAPSTKSEAVRSGTWATIRYARKEKKPLVIAFPDGSTEYSDGKG